MEYVTKDIPKLTAAMSAYDYSPGLHAKYLFLSTFNEEVNAAVRTGNTLWVPRESAPYAIPTQDFRAVNFLGAIDCKASFRHEQEELAQKSLDYLVDGRNHIFQAPTGWGKTVAGSAIACELGQTTLICVTKQDLMDQWYRSLTEICGVPSNQIGRVQGDECDYKGKRFVLGMVQSLMVEDKYLTDLYRYFGFVIFDEVHTMAADCFVRVCQTVSAKYRLGFSATPNRQDGKTKLLHWHIGPVLVKGTVIAMTPKVLVRQTGWRIPTRRKLVGNDWQQIPIPHAPGRMMLVTKAMVSSDPRNMEIVNFALQTYKAGRICLIMSDIKEAHLDRLFQMLTTSGVPGQDIGYYIGGMKKHELDATKKRRVVLATYQMCSTGTDCPAWDSLVLATPRANVEQVIGRVLRALDGKRQPLILDLVDKDSIFQSFHLSRMKQYYKVGAEIVKMVK